MRPDELAADIRSRLSERKTISHRMSALGRLCGRRKLTDPFLRLLEEELRKSGVHTSRHLSDRGLVAGDAVTFALDPLAPPEVAFGCERQLIELVRAGLGSVPPLQGLKVRGAEYRLPSRRRIDLLCEQVDRGRKGPLVAVELKRGRVGGRDVGQLMEYLSELSSQPMAHGRGVRGILIGESFTTEALRLVGGEHRWPIHCYRYSMAFEPVSNADGV